jgi:hypothetical protein
MNSLDPSTHPIDPLRFCASGAVADQRRRTLIARAAYFRARRRGFAPGHALDDWLAAEAEVDQQLAATRTVGSYSNYAAW